jgi:hypothetical protein
MKNQQECQEWCEPVAEGAVADLADKELFTADERERLRRFRRAVIRGERGDAYPIDKRQEFIRWLVDQGKLSDN